MQDAADKVPLFGHGITLKGTPDQIKTTTKMFDAAGSAAKAAATGGMSVITDFLQKVIEAGAQPDRDWETFW